ncbi:Uncharacterized protein FWK35_00030666 [Aphis craccivora]|uniref:Uncharacterized protein n=1 Tax=Aphis craccivora TaxID=307492 RepID=A0A6G0ZDY7_APHCR|nr:Uncharacterized protein FWK35_00030666 [Aphis craccivora]
MVSPVFVRTPRATAERHIRPMSRRSVFAGNSGFRFSLASFSSPRARRMISLFRYNNTL